MVENEQENSGEDSSSKKSNGTRNYEIESSIWIFAQGKNIREFKGLKN